MELDQARIAICERSWFDNLDLALHVLRRHAKAVALCALVGILPLALGNHLLVVRFDNRLLSDELSGPSYYILILLVMIEAPLATAPLTLYLGQALFIEQPEARGIAREFRACLPQLLLLQGVARALFVVPVITLIGPYVLWPFLSEVILLERNPLFGRPGQITTLRRNTILHRDSSGEFLLRAIGAAALAPMLVLALDATGEFLLENVLGYHMRWFAQAILFQAVLWIVAIYFTAARFLSYLDQRIRIEGWEVELLLRAERDRLTRHMT
jgi:hypothetical protein